jgi:lipoyl(octanoyl) transferase
MEHIFDVEDWGVIDFRTAWEMQTRIAQDVRSGQRQSVLIFCQHPTVITIGRNGSQKNVLETAEYLSMRNIEAIPINRGGDVTLHNPGQLIGYPIFNLSRFREDLHWFLRGIEDCIIAMLADFGITGERNEGLTGVWIDGSRKICAIGVHCSRWVTMHGFALNVCNDLSDFSMIVPCGIADKSVTSVCAELRSDVAFDEVQTRCRRQFEIFFSERICA